MTTCQRDETTNIPINEKYVITVREASKYYSIGIKRFRQLAEEHLGEFAIIRGNRYLILREKFEAFLAQITSV